MSVIAQKIGLADAVIIPQIDGYRSWFQIGRRCNGSCTVSKGVNRVEILGRIMQDKCMGASDDKIGGSGAAAKSNRCDVLLTTTSDKCDGHRGRAQHTGERMSSTSSLPLNQDEQKRLPFDSGRARPSTGMGRCIYSQPPDSP
jgi:hypothetical protein